jgi:hypothetical protein
MSMTPRASANTAPADGSRRDVLMGTRGTLAGAAVATASGVAATAAFAFSALVEIAAGSRGGRD